MTQIFKMAVRDLARNRRRSIFSSLALGIGLALLLLMASVLEGEMRDSMNSSIQLNSGHMQVRAESYLADRASLAWEDLLENPDTMASQIAGMAPVKFATPRLLASGIVTSGEQSMGVQVMGVDPASDANAPYRDGLLAGAFLAPDDREGILIGKPLADRGHFNVGDQINLMVNTSNGDVDQQLFTVRGIYSTNVSSYDERTVLMPLTKAQAITKTENHASIIFIMLHDRDQIDAMTAALKTGSLQVATWKSMNQLILDTEQMSAAYMSLLYLIVLGITATVIVNTLVMAVFERTREIGIMSAIGMKGPRIMSLFFTESVILAAGGVIIGLALGSLLVAYATYVGFYIGNLGVTGIMIGETIHGYWTTRNAVNLTAMAFIVTLLAALYPAMLAARLEPVEALRGAK